MPLRRAALLVTIALAVSALWSGLSELVFGLMFPERLGVWIVTAFITLLLDAPLIVMFALLWRQETAFALSKRQRYLLWVLALISASSLVTTVGAWWQRKPDPNAERLAQHFSRLFLVARSPSIADGFAVLSGVTFVIFLIALSRHDRRDRNAADQPDEHPRLIRRAALAATLTGGLGMVLGVAAQLAVLMVHAQSTDPPSPLTILRGALSRLPVLIAPWIIYVSVRGLSPTAESGGPET